MIHWNETLERAEDDTKILSKVTGSMELPLTEDPKLGNSSQACFIILSIILTGKSLQCTKT